MCKKLPKSYYNEEFSAGNNLFKAILKEMHHKDTSYDINFQPFELAFKLYIPYFYRNFPNTSFHMREYFVFFHVHHIYVGVHSFEIFLMPEKWKLHLLYYDLWKMYVLIVKLSQKSNSYLPQAKTRTWLSNGYKNNSKNFSKCQFKKIFKIIYKKNVFLCSSQTLWERNSDTTRRRNYRSVKLF